MGRVLGGLMSDNEKEWHDSDKIVQVFGAFVEGKPEYPVICPECGEKDAHIYLNRNVDSSLGGAWAWCGKCHSYGHYSYIAPKWWGNLAEVDQKKLCGANPEEPARHEATIDNYVNEQLMRYCMSENVCRYCLHKNYKNPQIGKCLKCGKETMMATLDGPCMILSCSNCGFEIVGASFFPPCHNDDLDYTFSVKDVDKVKKVKLAKLFNINVMDLIKALREDGHAQKAVKLFEAEELYAQLKDLEVEFEITPDFTEKYPDLIGCKAF